MPSNVCHGYCLSARCLHKQRSGCGIHSCTSCTSFQAQCGSSILLRQKQRPCNTALLKVTWHNITQAECSEAGSACASQACPGNHGTMKAPHNRATFWGGVYHVKDGVMQPPRQTSAPTADRVVFQPGLAKMEERKGSSSNTKNVIVQLQRKIYSLCPVRLDH